VYILFLYLFKTSYNLFLTSVTFLVEKLMVGKYFFQTVENKKNNNLKQGSLLCYRYLKLKL